MPAIRIRGFGTPRLPIHNMAYKFREEIVGKRFLSVSGFTKLKVNKISEWGWRAGVIRAASHRDNGCHDLQVSTAICLKKEIVLSRPSSETRVSTGGYRRITLVRCVCGLSGIARATRRFCLRLPTDLTNIQTPRSVCLESFYKHSPFHMCIHNALKNEVHFVP